MGIQTKFTNFAPTNMADDMLARLVADHSAQRVNFASGITQQAKAEVTADFVKEQFRVTDIANAALAGGKLPFTLEVSGQYIVRGHVGLFPEKLLQAALMGRRLPIIEVKWHFEAVKDSALDQVIRAYIRADNTLKRIQDSYQLAALLSNVHNDQMALFQFLLKRYALREYRKHPELVRSISQARKLWRAYRAIQFAEGLVKSKDDNSEVLSWIAGELISRSPVHSGTYRDAHMLYADQRPLMAATDIDEETEVPQAREYSFTNTVLYARKIEFGKTESGRDFVISVPNHIYERVAEDARTKFRDVADIAYEVRAVTAGVQTPQRHAKRQHNISGVRYPSIVVTF